MHATNDNQVHLRHLTKVHVLLETEHAQLETEHAQPLGAITAGGKRDGNCHSYQHGPSADGGRSGAGRQ